MIHLPPEKMQGPGPGVRFMVAIVKRSSELVFFAFQGMRDACCHGVIYDRTKRP